MLCFCRLVFSSFIRAVKGVIVFLICLTTRLVSVGQSFAVSDTTVLLEVTTSNGVAHWYTAITNLTDDTVWMRWIQYRPTDYPSASWTTYFQDPQTWYNPVDGVDSGDFFLDTVADPMDKLVLQVNHHGIADRGDVYFLVFNRDNPADSVWVHYEVFINQDVKVEEYRQADCLWFSGDEICLSNRYTGLQAFDMSGRELSLIRTGENQYKLTPPLAEQWVVFVATTTDGQRCLLKRFIH